MLALCPDTHERTPGSRQSHDDRDHPVADGAVPGADPPLRAYGGTWCSRTSSTRPATSRSSATKPAGRLQQLHFDCLDKAVAAHRGRIVDTAGDGAFMFFESAIDAARSMVLLQQLLSTENQTRPRAHQVTVRIGMHWGPVLTDGDVVTGDSVNLCARIASSAQPGQIRLSRELLTQLDLSQRELCRPLPAVPLKGISRQVDLLDLPWRDSTRFPRSGAGARVGRMPGAAPAGYAVFRPGRGHPGPRHPRHHPGLAGQHGNPPDQPAPFRAPQPCRGLCAEGRIEPAHGGRTAW